MSYIGVDGQDGAAGSPIAIKTERFDSKEGLPTEGANLGDAYIVGENLWVYNGNNIESEKTYRGFVNVGKFVGPAGKTGCFHVAWCNGDPANGDYTGFDIDAPDGSMFDYMGTYVDYVDSPEEAYNHPDSTDPTKYTWTKIRGVDGEDAVTLDFDNDSDGVGLTYEGLIDADKTITTNVGMFEGQKVMELISIECNAPEGMVVSTALTGSGVERYPGIINFSVKKGDSYIKSGSNNISVTVTARCTGSNKTHVITKSFHILGNKAGKPGESAVVYNIETSRDEIHKFSSGDYEVNFISVTKIYKQVGANPKEEYTGAYELRYDIDHKNQGYGNREKQTQCTVGYGVSVANVKVCLDFYLYIDGKPADHEHVEVHADGTIGEALKIVNTEYRYAVSMTFTKTPNDLTSWSTEPVDVEPGQYLFIEEKRYWSDGSVTYAYTWTRGGNNGYSNLPFISTVFTRSASAPSTPTGGTFDNPLPTSSDWSDGVPAGTAKLWMSHRKFTADGLPPQESEWSTPESALSSSDVTIKYSSFEECPKNPDVASSTSWVSIPNENSIWMAIQKIVDRVAQPWELRKIKGEKGSIDTSSASTPYMGEWRADGLYCGNKLRTDIVKVSGTDSPGEEATYYYIANKAKGFGLDNNGVCVGETTPKPGTTAGGSYWLKFSANFDNIATGLIFSEEVIADTMTAINAHIDQLNTDDLIAKKLRTKENGDLISIENNKIRSLSSNSTVFTVDPNIGITSDNGLSIDATATYPANKTIISKSISNTSKIEEVSTTLCTISRKEFNGYIKHIATESNRIRLSISGGRINLFTASFSVYAKGNASTSISIKIASGTITTKRLYEGYVDLKSTVSKELPLSYGDTFTITASCYYTIAKPESDSTTIQAYLVNSGTVKIFDNDNIFIGKDGIRVGSNLGGTKVLIDTSGKSDNILSISNGNDNIFTVGDSIKVSTDRRGLVQLKNPMVYNIGNDTSIPADDMNNIYSCFINGIPVYITGLYTATFDSNSRIISYMSMIEDMHTTNSSTRSGECVFLATCGLHNMDMNSLAETTDYRLNIFIHGNIGAISNTPFTTSASVSIYQHTV